MKVWHLHVTLSSKLLQSTDELVTIETSLKSPGMLQRREDPQVLSELNFYVVFSANSENNYSYGISKPNFAKAVFKSWVEFSHADEEKRKRRREVSVQKQWWAAAVMSPLIVPLSACRRVWNSVWAMEGCCSLFFALWEARKGFLFDW